jgi:hypothetical protein
LDKYKQGKKEVFMKLSSGKKSSSGHSNNILRMFDMATMDEIYSGCEWYAEANRQARTISANTGYNLTAVCGIIAALSPRNKWSRNIEDVRNLLADDDAKVSTFHRNKAKAAEIKSLLNPSFDQVLDIIKGDKVCSFYANILNPNLLDIVTVDSHAIGVWLGTRAVKVAAKGVAYQTIQQAYVDTAKELCLIPCQLQAITWLTYRRINNIK